MYSFRPRLAISRRCPQSRRMKHLYAFVVLLVFLVVSAPARAIETPISVSVLSNDGKFIGSSLGGMHITIHEIASGRLLASGKTTGSTGDTARLMTHPHERDFVLRTEGSSRFDAVLELDRPTSVRITAFGPLAQRQAASTVSETWTLIPGKDYADGNGILLTLHGMVVDVLDPPAHLKTGAVDMLRVEANVMKMCGCPVGESTPWPVERYRVEARLYEATGELLEVVPLRYTGEHSQFAGDVPMPGVGAYEIIVTAFDPATKDSGADTTTVILAEE